MQQRYIVFGYSRLSLVVRGFARVWKLEQAQENWATIVRYHRSSCCTRSYLTAACSDNPDELSRVPTSLLLLEVLSKLLVPDSISLYPRYPSSPVRSDHLSHRVFECIDRGIPRGRITLEYVSTTASRRV